MSFSFQPSSESTHIILDCKVQLTNTVKYSEQDNRSAHTTSIIVMVEHVRHLQPLQTMPAASLSDPLRSSPSVPLASSYCALRTTWNTLSRGVREYLHAVYITAVCDNNHPNLLPRFAVPAWKSRQCVAISFEISVNSSCSNASITC